MNLGENIKLKVCGMTQPENIQAVAALQPDYLGFIFYTKSPRFFSRNIPDISKTVKKTGVFVNETIQFIIQNVSAFNLTAVQLHGEESPEYCSKLKLKLKDVELIKVFSIKDSFDFSVLNAYENYCDLFLFDTKGKNPGGNGFTFNWEVLKNYPSKKPFFLSGGIGMEQIEEIKKFFQNDISKKCYGIDVNSQFEIQPGLKNPDLLKQFIKELWGLT